MGKAQQHLRDSRQDIVTMDNDMIEGKDNFTVRPTRRHRFGHLLAALLLVSNAATFLVTVHFFYGWHWLSHTRRPLQSTRPVGEFVNLNTLGRFSI